ncbi:ATP-grasp domain-containing protein [Marinirhabdus gelatinilytica]|uniref:Ribosomal protein S6--L-glutamate ligase n=1 Tax=Marinirhabdus gelatinilytica TaxID=1703343 RepID=A0A370QK23_9FLAO|nr:RimK family alpha-L-glutamate ligase [Marinirhabdus gelatinilytica]RDK88702.1 ribosomal protein S6--L-glutamate ligase [Marinirhabdus gelatinilytica]
MNIAILSRGENLYSTKSLLKAGEARNHTMEVLNPLYFNLTVEAGKPVLYYHDEVVDDLHAVIPRIGASNTLQGSSLVRHFEGAGVTCAVSAEGILNSRDKWTCFQILAKADIPIPNTVLGDYYDASFLLENFKEKPVIIKILEGTHGNGVILSESPQNALATIETLQTSKVRFILQEYIAESKGEDLRAIVVDGVVVAAMKRSCKAGDFRSNLHRGGSAQPIQLSYEEERVALKAAKALRLGVCGVDILQSDRGPLVLEINSTPGLEGIENTTGKNISKSIIGYLERTKR